MHEHGTARQVLGSLLCVDAERLPVQQVGVGGQDVVVDEDTQACQLGEQLLHPFGCHRAAAGAAQDATVP